MQGIIVFYMIQLVWVNHEALPQNFQTEGGILTKKTLLP